MPETARSHGPYGRGGSITPPIGRIRTGGSSARTEYPKTGTFLVEGAASGAARPRPREIHRFARLAWPPNHTTRKTWRFVSRNLVLTRGPAAAAAPEHKRASPAAPPPNRPHRRRSTRPRRRPPRLHSSGPPPRAPRGGASTPTAARPPFLTAGARPARPTTRARRGRPAI